MITILIHISFAFEDFGILAKALFSYVINIYPFNIGFVICFLLISVFSSYFLFGDFSLYYYKNYAFMFIKVLQSFWRGSMDNIDHDSRIDRNTVIHVTANANKPYQFYIQNSVSPYFSIITSSSYSGYIIVNKIF